MRWLPGLILIALVGLAPMVLAEDPATDETKRLEGSWKVVAIETDGQKASAEALEALKDGGWSFKGSELSFEGAHPGKASFKVDPNKSPKEIDLIALDGRQKGKTGQGIYKLEEGTLTVCLRDLASAEKGRPAEFVTEAGSGLGLIVLKRRDPK